MRWTILVGVLIMAVVAAGCEGIVARQAISTATGASVRYFEIRSAGGPTSLDRFRIVAVEAFDASPMLGAIPPEVPVLVQAAAIQRVMEMRAFDAVVRRAAGAAVQTGLVIRGKFVDYDPGGSVLRATGFGVDPFVTAQIELVDASTNHAIGVAMVTSTVKSAFRTGPHELAEGIGKAVKGVLERHHTKVEEEHAQPSQPAGTRPAEEKKGFRLPFGRK